MPTPKKSYVFTLNNYTDEEEQRINKFIGTESIYAIVGRERGESGTPHLQGYVQLRRSLQFKTIKDRLHPRCHVEVAAGSPHENRSYCSKGGEFREYGDIERAKSNKSARLSREQLATTFESYVREGFSGVGKFADEFPGTWIFSGSTMLRNYLARQPVIERPDISVQWFYGEPGTGKSRKAHEEMPEAYVKEPKSKWWNGYCLEKSVILDDFGPNGIDLNHLLRWFDRYKCLVESKGGMLPLYADKFIVTSNFHPEDVFKFGEYVNPQLPALLRRIKLIKFD